MIRYFLWGKRVGNDIVKPFAVLMTQDIDAFGGAGFFTIILQHIKYASPSDDLQNLWNIVASELLKHYPGVFPKLWSDDGYVNPFWVWRNNVIIEETDIGADWIDMFPVFEL